ncbi:MAG: hypothetical protein ABR880_04590 [Candidatus Sulfotelmatobacter sp.]|jgi:hypothetical protein
MRALLLAGLLEFALGVAFLAVPVARIQFVEDRTEDAKIEVQSTPGDREPPIISFVLIASGIALTGANALRKN